MVTMEPANVAAHSLNVVWSGNWICMNLRWFPAVAGTRDNEL